MILILIKIKEFLEKNSEKQLKNTSAIHLMKIKLTN